ncbi:hypothetical protein [Alkalihalobacterium alkalinitrilicum]|uniref:hypothetical protein n=1 Tax=Alkalihalobacterium alkalinitrilicum TaxID=427920 RepID=UPI001EE44E2E|nr:hypothetical protein [Alkalihalobacterium alkalinitrilicum]
MLFGRYGNNEKLYQQSPNSEPSYSKNPPITECSIQDLFKGKNLDLIAAALLLTGKLKVDSVELFRGSPVVVVTLLGKYLTTGNDKSNALADFLEENGDMTLDDVFDAFQKRMEKGR